MKNAADFDANVNALVQKHSPCGIVAAVWGTEGSEGQSQVHGFSRQSTDELDEGEVLAMGSFIRLGYCMYRQEIADRLNMPPDKLEAIWDKANSSSHWKSEG